MVDSPTQSARREMEMLQKQLDALWLTKSALAEQISAAKQRAAERQAELGSSCGSLVSSDGESFCGRRRMREDDGAVEDDNDEFPTYRGSGSLVTEALHSVHPDDPVYRCVEPHIQILRSDSGPSDEFDAHTMDLVADDLGGVTWRSASFEEQQEQGLPADDGRSTRLLAVANALDLPALVECVAKLSELSAQGSACDETLLREELERVMRVLG